MAGVVISDPTGRTVPGLVSFFDTATLPDEGMLDAMRSARLGDDVYGLDPTVNELQELAGAVLGKEAGLFLPSGTMANLVALLVHTNRGDEVVVEESAHILASETGGISAVAGCVPLPVAGGRGVLRASTIEERLRDPDDHHPRTRLVCVENTHNRAGGTVTSTDVMAELRDLCDRRALLLHVDGARIFNAAVALGVPARDLVASADSACFSLSKGLGAPVGSVLLGAAGFIAEARRARKMLGGGMRQAGVLAAAGIVALRTGVDRLAQDHRVARELGERLTSVPGIDVDMDSIQTNMVLFGVSRTGVSATDVATGLLERGVHCAARPPDTIRAVVHRQIGSAEIDALIGALSEVVHAG